MGNFNLSVLLLFCLTTIVLADSRYFTPRSYYVIDKNGHKSDVIYLTPRVKREIFDKLHVIRKRDVGSPKCKGLSTNVDVLDGSSELSNDFFSAVPPPEFKQFMEQVLSQFPNVPSVPNYAASNDIVRNLASRFGGGEELSDSGELENVPGISVSSKAAGPRGAWSSSATSIDSSGRATYDVKSGKF